MKLKFNTWALAIFCVAQSSTCLPAPIEPLNQLPDAVGQSLQQQMIWADPNAKLQSAFVDFRKRFFLADAPVKANLHIFADVRYMLWINGRYVLRGPVRFVPSGPEYDSDDVTSYLQPGNNELVVLVLANQSNGKMMHHAPGLAVRLEILGAQGTQTVVATDPTWKWSDQTRYRTPRVDWETKWMSLTQPWKMGTGFVPNTTTAPGATRLKLTAINGVRFRRAGSRCFKKPRWTSS